MSLFRKIFGSSEDASHEEEQVNTSQAKALNFQLTNSLPTYLKKMVVNLFIAKH